MTQRKPFKSSERIDMKHVGRSGTIAILATNDFKVSDMQEIANTLEKEGFRTVLISPLRSMVMGRMDKGEEVNFTIDKHPGELSQSEIDGAIFLHSNRSDQTLSDDQDTRLLAIDLKKSGKPVLATGSAITLISEDEDTDTSPTSVAIALDNKLFSGQGEDALKTAMTAYVTGLNQTDPVAA